MLDPTVFAVPLLGAGALFLLSIMSSNDLVIDAVQVPTSLSDRGYSSVVVGRMLTDELRLLNEAANRELNGVRVYGTNLDTSLYDLSQYFGFSGITSDIRNIVVGIPYYVRSEILDDNGTFRFEARIFRSQSAKVDVVRVELKPDAKPDTIDPIDGTALRPLLHEAAEAILTTINPYIVAVHLARNEADQGKWEFQKSTDFLEGMLVNSDPNDDHLAYELLGRLRFWRVEGDPSLSQQEVATNLEEAARLLRKSLVKEPDFFFANLTLARIEARQGDIADSDRLFAKAVAEEPDSLQARIAWGKTLAKQGRTRDAIFQFVAAAEIDPTNANVRRALSELYIKAGDPEAARIQAEAAYHLDPSDGYESRYME
jgi:tetratricopeptide (TPR) repeat protein